MSGTAAGVLAGATVTTVLAAVEAATGVCIPLFVWGAVGGLWAFKHLDPMSLGQRLFSLAIAGLLASVTAKAVALILIGAAKHFLSWWPPAVDAQQAAWGVALAIGLLCHTVIGRKLIEVAGRRADEVAK